MMLSRCTTMLSLTTLALVVSTLFGGVLAAEEKGKLGNSTIERVSRRFSHWGRHSVGHIAYRNERSQTDALRLDAEDYPYSSALPRVGVSFFMILNAYLIFLHERPYNYGRIHCTRHTLTRTYRTGARSLSLLSVKHWIAACRWWDFGADSYVVRTGGVRER